MSFDALRFPRPALGALAALLVSGCVVAARPAPRPMPAPQAVAIATQYARSRGLVVDYTIAAHLDRRARWHVDLGGAGGRDQARVVLDGFSGAILHARLAAGGGAHRAAPPPPPPPGAPSASPPPGASPPDAPAAPGAEPPAAQPPGPPPGGEPPPPPPATPPPPAGSRNP